MFDPFCYRQEWPHAMTQIIRSNRGIQSLKCFCRGEQGSAANCPWLIFVTLFKKDRTDDRVKISIPATELSVDEILTLFNKVR